MNGDEIRQMLRLGILDRNHPADCEIARSLLDPPKETSVTWDGIPEHRNLSGDGDEPPKTADDYRREIADWLGSRPRPAPSTAAEFMRGQAARMGRHPADDPMPADPFNGITEAAVAQVAMIEALREAGLPEPSALFYVACLVQVGLGQSPQEPEQM